MMEDFLDMLAYDFEQKVWPKLTIQGGVVLSLPPQYEQRFDHIMAAWEAKKAAQSATKVNNSGGSGTKIHKMRTFDQSNKSKKALKKEAKKQAIAQEGGQSSSIDDDDVAVASPSKDEVLAAREKLKSKLTPGKKKSEPAETKVEPDGYDTDEAEREYQRVRSTMAGPKKSVTIKDMESINVSTGKEHAGDAKRALDAKKQEFMGGEEDDLKDRGFMDSDDEIDFSNFKVGREKKDVEEEEAAPSLFGRLSSAF